MSPAFEHSWVNLYKFILGALGVPCRYIETTSIFFFRVYKISFSRGKVGLGIYLKESQRCLLQFLSGNPVGKSVVKLEKGLPLILPGFIRAEILGGNIFAIRMALTLLGFVRTIFHRGDVKYSNITDPTKWAPSPSKKNRMTKEIRTVLRWLKVAPWRIPKDEPAGPKSNRGGPNGHATLAAHWDALALKESGLWGTFADLCKVLGSSHLTRKVEALSLITGNWVARFPSLLLVLPCHFASLGKLGVKDEPCGKKRVFAISDYWTQAVCKPLHDYLMKVLKKLPMDGTWDQGKASLRVAKWSADPNRTLFCYDLSAATDRFPGGMIALVLGCLIGFDAASLWLTLLTNRDYWHKGKGYRYSAGQPMGTLSSWASFALTHHVIVQISALRAGWTGLFQDYALLGDDIVIADADVAEEYRDLMAWLFVEINMSKSLVGKGCAEFAKRHFYKGREVTGVAGGLIQLAGTRLSGLRVLTEHCLQRGWVPTMASFVSSCTLYAPSMEHMRGWRSILVSLLGPGAPLTIASALWGGLPEASLESLIRTQLAPSKLIPVSTAATHSQWSLIGPCEEAGSLVAEIFRHFELARIRRARESHAKWRDLLLGSLDSLLKGWILRAPEKKATRKDWTSSDLTVARDLLQAGHPAGQISPMSDDLETEHSEMELHDLSVTLSRGDHLSPAVWGLAPSGDLKLLQSAAEATAWGFEVIRCVRSTLPLAFEWQEPGALEMIREGLTLEIGEILKPS